MIYTAQYRYPGQDRLDITVKGNCPAGKLYAPTWDMVNRIKSGLLTEEGYTQEYYDLLIRRWKKSETNRQEMLTFVKMITDRDITVVCFCPRGAFCHRHLLVRFLIHNYPQVQYGGEREV